MISGNRNLPRGSKPNVPSVSTAEILSVAREVMSLVMMPLLDFVMVY